MGSNKSKNNNKKLYTVLAAVILLSFVGTAVLIAFLPDRLPMHYDIQGNVDRVGSKFEMLLFPAIALIMGSLLAFVAKRERRKSERSNEKPILYIGIFFAAFFAAIGFYLMAKSLDGAVPKAENINTFTCIGMGLLMILIGNIMPKARMNAAFGLRTSWSMANDRVWQKSQRSGGIALVAAGAIMIILSVFIPGIWSMLASLAVILITVVISIVASYRYYKKDMREH